MNREQRERREHGPLLPSRLSVPTLEWRGNLLLGLYLEPLRGYRGHSPFLFAAFAPFAVSITTDTPFEFHEPRRTR